MPCDREFGDRDLYRKEFSDQEVFVGHRNRGEFTQLVQSLPTIKIIMMTVLL